MCGLTTTLSIDSSGDVTGRFELEHVERGAGDHAGLERRDQRRLVDDRAAGGVDEHGVGPHQPQRVGVDQVARARQQRAVQRDDARCWRSRSSSGVELSPRAGSWISRSTSNPASRSATRRPIAPQPTRPTVVPGELAWCVPTRSVPSTAAHVALELGDAPQQRRASGPRCDRRPPARYHQGWWRSGPRAPKRPPRRSSRKPTPTRADHPQVGGGVEHLRGERIGRHDRSRRRRRGSPTTPRACARRALVRAARRGRRRAGRDRPPRRPCRSQAR